MSQAVSRKPIPTIGSNGNHTRVQHTEYFASVVSTTTDFTVTSYPCNPGVGSMFPWLCAIAQRYETYKFLDITFHYHTRASTSQVGTVGLVFDFDANDEAPTSQMAALSYHDKVADSPWQMMSFKLDLRQGDKLPTRYTRVGALGSVSDLKTLDLGNLHVFTDGVAASANLGLLEICYTVDLFTPQIEDPVGGTLSCNAGLSGTVLFGTNLAEDPQAEMPFDASSDQLVFNQFFEGVINFVFTGTGITESMVWTLTGEGATQVMWQNANAAGTKIVGYGRVRAVPGTIFKPSITCTTINVTNWTMARCGYDSLA